MPDLTPVIGGTATFFVPDDTALIALGYTGIHVYWGGSRIGPWTLVNTITLVGGQEDYSYTNPTATSSDWFYGAYYGAVPGEAPPTEAMPVGPTRVTRKQIRQGAGRRLLMLDIVTVDSAADSSHFQSNMLIDPDASAFRMGNRFARPSTGAQAGSVRRIRAGATGYDVAAGAITLARPLAAQVVTGDEIELWLSRGDQDMGTLVDEAMNRARTNVWWEDTFYLTVDANVSETVVPEVIREERAKRVDYAADLYPNRPGWRPVPYWDMTTNGGQTIISALALGQGTYTFSQGRVLRIMYNRPGARMEQDTDYWSVPLEWAIEETAYEVLKTLAPPRGGKEDTSDARQALQDFAQSVMEFRSAYMPSTAMRTRLPR